MKSNRILTKSHRQLTIIYAMFLIIFVMLFTAIPLYIQDRASHVALPTPPSDLANINSDFIQNEVQRGTTQFRNRLLLINGVFIIVAIGGSYILAKRTLKPLEETLDKQEAFASEVAHELKTPLANILMQISAHQKTNKKIGKQEQILLNDISNQIKDLGLTADNILRLVAVDFVDDTLFKEPTNVSILATSAAKDFTTKAKAKQLQLVSEVSAGAIIKANSLQIKQLMNILIDNAIKFTPEKGKVIVGVSKNTEHIILSIKDTGIGIPASEQTAVFNRFYQVETNLDEGSGLGLAIAKRIVDLHHGSIVIESNENAGTTFIITLPLES